MFDALREPGAELPKDDNGQYNAHISVARPEEVAQMGGPSKITERGNEFTYTLGATKDFNPGGWAEMSKCWVIDVRSPALEKLRTTYGLPAKSKYPFHITFAVRRAGVLGDNSKSKVQPEPGRTGGIKLTDAPGIHLRKAALAATLKQGSDNGRNQTTAGAGNAGRDSGRGQEVPGCSVAALFTDLAGSAKSAGTAKEAGVRSDAGGEAALPPTRNVAYAGPKRRSDGKKLDPSYSPEHPEECCPFCGTRLERGDDGNCNRCGHAWPGATKNAGSLRVRDGGSSAVLGGGGQPPHREKAASTVTLGQSIARAARKAVNPTEAQAEAGNYRKGHVRAHGFDITIENAKGATRTGTDPRGRTWSTTFKNHYGYIRGTKGKDGDHVAVFLGPEPTCELIYVVDQIDPVTKVYDECKCMIGFTTLKSAKEAYLANYEDGWKGLGKITPLTLDQFKIWLDEGSQRRPMAAQTFRMKKAGDDKEPSDEDAPVMVIHRSTTIRMIVPGEKLKDADGELPEMPELPDMPDEFKQLLKTIGGDKGSKDSD